MANTDFIGFTFNNQRSSDYNIYSVSDGSRYQEDLVPSPIDYSENIIGGVGQYYFGSDIDSKEFSLSIAYDNLSEKQIRQMRKWLSPNAIGDLIFDERPYKVYTAKISDTPNLEFICFDAIDDEGNKKRVYKGEGSINFICYNPLAKARTITLSDGSVAPADIKWYQDQGTFSNIEEWSDTAGLVKDWTTSNYNKFGTSISGRTGAYVYNPGDFESGIILSFHKPAGIMSEQTFLLEGSNFPKNLSYYSLTISARGDTTTDSEKYGVASDEETSIAEREGTIKIDTNKNIVTFTDSSTNIEEPAYFLLKKGFLFKIPPCEDGVLYTEINGIDQLKIEYDYLYY